MSEFNYSHPQVSICRVQDGPMTYAKLVVSCADPKCRCQFEKRVSNHRPYPTEALRKFVENAGWSSNGKKPEFLCPDHS